MNKKLSVLQIVRHAVQLAAFILFPGLFILVYSSVKGLFLSAVGGTFSLAANGTDLAITVAVLPVTILFGRFFCGFLCSFGAMGDLMYFLSGRILKKRPQIPGRADKILKWLKYVILAALVAFAWRPDVKVSESLNPWHVFGVYSSVKGYSQVSAAFSIGGALLLAIMIASLFFERFFCRYLCPLGAIFTPISRLRLFRFSRNNEKCTGCGLCDKKCSMGIQITGMEKIRSGECIDCMRCADICPADAVSSNAKPLIAGAAATASIVGIYYVGTICAANVRTDIPVMQEAETGERGDYSDGVWSGTADGYRGKTEVNVTVENGYITDIDIVSTSDDKDFFNRAKDVIIGNIISEQSTDVSAVSGATYSSKGIINAVKTALGIAFTEEQKPDSGNNSHRGGRPDKGHGKHAH